MHTRAPRAVILVNLHGGAGRCSHCGGRTELTRAHDCGALIEGVVINARIASDPTQAQAHSVADRCYPHRLLGVGLLEYVGGRWRFDLLKASDQIT